LPDFVTSNMNSSLSSGEMEELLRTLTFPVVIYLHGNSFDRSRAHRCKMYNVLSALNFHILAVDYRGYGDSSGFPTEVGVIQDVKELYKYARKFVEKERIYIWGHSMGTGYFFPLPVAMELSEVGSAPAGLVLESPFNNLRDEIHNHWLSTPIRHLPWFDQIIIDPLEYSGLKMSSDIRITRFYLVLCPILILHAADDRVIPVGLGNRLYKAALSAGREATYIEFESKYHFEHKYIYRSKELPSIIK
uniref:Lysophosphatidylserine lipase ABHD12 n=1 Tax=Dracunculus medinensis TaxID=318479 RepID=A0A0N4UR74_DRAME